MLSLESNRWIELSASPGGSGALSARLIAEAKTGSSEALDELLHQSCHQLSVGEVAYAVVPHAVEIAKSATPQNRVRALLVAGTVAACVGAFSTEVPSVPQDLSEHYAASSHAALLLAVNALQDTSWSPGDVVTLLGVVAAYQGRYNLAIHLFLHGGSDSELACPECGEYISWSNKKS